MEIPALHQPTEDYRRLSPSLSAQLIPTQPTRTVCLMLAYDKHDMRNIMPAYTNENHKELFVCRCRALMRCYLQRVKPGMFLNSRLPAWT